MGFFEKFFGRQTAAEELQRAGIPMQLILESSTQNALVSEYAWRLADEPERYGEYGPPGRGAEPGLDAYELEVSAMGLPKLDLENLGPPIGPFNPDTLPALAVYWNAGPWPTCCGTPCRLLVVNPNREEIAWLEETLGQSLLNSGAEPEKRSALSTELQDRNVGKSPDCGVNVFGCPTCSNVATVLTHT